MTLPDSLGRLTDNVLIRAVKFELCFSALLFLPYAIDCVQIEIKLHNINMLNFCIILVFICKIELHIIPIEMLQYIFNSFLI